MGEKTEECSWLWEHQVCRCQDGIKLVCFGSQRGPFLMLDRCRPTLPSLALGLEFAD